VRQRKELFAIQCYLRMENTWMFVDECRWGNTRTGESQDVWENILIPFYPTSYYINKL
jgi:hypothetical protein